MKFLRTSLVLMGMILLSAPLQAAGTSLWDVSGIPIFLQGEFEGTGLTSRGEVVPTVSTRETAIPARLVWETQSVPKGLLVGTSLPATLQIIGDTEGSRRLIRTNDLGFTALASTNRAVYAAASPSGTIYRYDPDSGSLVAHATLPDSYVWSMIPDHDRRGLFIGTGPSGTLYHMDPSGEIEVRTQLPGNNILSLAHYRQQLYMGDDQGGLYRLDRSGELKSVYGYNRGEIAALAADGRYLYVGVNQRKPSRRESEEKQNISALARQLRQQSLQNRTRRIQPPENTHEPDRVRSETGNVPAQNNSSPAMVEAIRKSTQQQGKQLFAGLAGTLVFRMKPPGRMNVVYDDPQEIVHDLEAHRGEIYVATGGKGRLYKVKRNFTRIAFFQSQAKLVLDVLLEDGTPRALTTGEGGSLHRRSEFTPEDVVYRSAPLDAELLSQWGSLERFGSSDLQVRTRSGNSESPNAQWSRWSRWFSRPQFPIPSSPARFVQFEVRFPRPDARLKRVEISYRLPNQRPRITNLQVSPNPFRAALTLSRSDGGHEGQSPNKQSSPPDREIPEKVPRKRQVNWSVHDPDGDPLKTRLYYRPQDGDRWISFTGDRYQSSSSYVWDVSEFSDGWYELRLTVTDRFENPPDRGFRAHKYVGPVLVDNTSPVLSNVRLQNGRLSFRAKDETSRIFRAQFRINSGPWHNLSPSDGIFDQHTETVRFSIPESATTGDLLQLRVYDEAGNQARLRRNIP